MTPSTFSGSFKWHQILKWINAPVQVSGVSVTSFCQPFWVKVYEGDFITARAFLGKYFELAIGLGQTSSMIFKLFHPGNICGCLSSAVRSGFLACSVQLEDNCCMSACLSCLLQVSFTLLSTWREFLQLVKIKNWFKGSRNRKNRLPRVFGLGVFSSVLKTTVVKVCWGNGRERCHFISHLGQSQRILSCLSRSKCWSFNLFWHLLDCRDCSKTNGFWSFLESCFLFPKRWWTLL